MNDLPLELIDTIFSYFDGLSLARSKQVCRRWRDLHSQPNNSYLWRQVCYKEITTDILAELNEYLICTEDGPLDGDIVSSTPNHEIGWKEVFKKWYRSRHIGHWPSLVIELKGHVGPVWDAKFSGDRVVTCGSDSTIRIWDGWTGHCLNVLTGHAQGVLCIALRRKPGSSPDADKPHDLIVSGSKDNSICLWDMDKGVCLRSLFGHTLWVNSISVQKNIIVSGSDDGSVKIWDFEQDTPEILHSLQDHDDWVKCVSLWNDVILSATDKGLMALWSVRTGELLASVRDNTQGTGMSSALLRGNNALSLSCGGRLTAWQYRVDSDGTIDTSVLRSYSIIGPPPAGIQMGECLALRGPLVAIGTPLGAVYVYHLKKNWDMEFRHVHTIVQSGQSPIHSVAIGDDGEGPTLLTGGEDGIARVHRWFPLGAANMMALQR